MPHANGMPTLDDLRNMPDEELAEKVDRQYSLTPDVRHLLLAQCFRDELIRREQDRNTQRMLDYTNEMHRFTRQVRNMTVIILVATILSVVASAVTLSVGLGRQPEATQSQSVHPH
jgi:hypothetical protein